MFHGWCDVRVFHEVVFIKFNVFLTHRARLAALP